MAEKGRQHQCDDWVVNWCEYLDCLFQCEAKGLAWAIEVQDVTVKCRQSTPDIIIASLSEKGKQRPPAAGLRYGEGPMGKGEKRDIMFVVD